jgi:hypothetical protein
MVRRCMFVAVAVLVLGGVALAQDKVDLKLRMSKGDSFAFNNQSVVRLQIKVTAGPQTQEVNQTLTDLSKGTFTVLAAENGVPSSVRVAYAAVGCGGKTEIPGKPAEDKPSPLAGKTITVTRGADGKATTDFPGQLDEQSLKDVSGHLEADAEFMPKQPVAVGEEWDADQAALRRGGFLGPNDTAQVRLKLLQVTDEGGVKKAQIGMKGSLQIQPVPNVPVKAEIEGTIVLDLARGNAIAVNLKGTITIAATQQVPGDDGKAIAVQIAGTGTMEAQSSTTFTGNAP